MSRLTKLALLGVVLLFVTALLLMWFLPLGTGEYRNSPDGRYLAEVSNLNRGTWLASRIDFIEFKLSETSNGRPVCRAQFYHHGNNVPSYGDRSQTFLNWAADSSSVTIPIANGKQVIFPVP